MNEETKKCRLWIIFKITEIKALKITREKFVKYVWVEEKNHNVLDELFLAKYFDGDYLVKTGFIENKKEFEVWNY